MTSDPMTDLRLANPVTDVAGYDHDRTTALLDRAMIRTAAGSPRRPRRAATLAIGAATAIAAGGGGLAYAVLHQPAETALKINCAVGVTRADFDAYGGFTVVLDTTSGDPVADCAAEYKRLEGAAPQLRAYDTGASYVAVMPAEWPAPPGWVPLASEFVSDAARLELKQRLDDLIDGTQSRCMTAAQAEQMARGELSDLGMSGWTVERLSAAGRADGDRWCAIAWPDEAGAPKILIQGIAGLIDPDADGTQPLDNLIAQLRRDIADRCVTLQSAEAVAREAVTRHGFAVSEAKITTIGDPESPCTRVDLLPAGLVTIILRGPANTE